MEAKRVLATSEAARVLGVSDEMVRTWARSGRLPAFAVTGEGMRLYTPEDVEQLRQAREAAQLAQQK